MGYEPKDPAHRDWIKEHEDSLVYSEPAGQWLVRTDLYWELETRNRGNPIARCFCSRTRAISISTPTAGTQKKPLSTLITCYKKS
jgi:hypothetical protein